MGLLRRLREQDRRVAAAYAEECRHLLARIDAIARSGGEGGTLAPVAPFHYILTIAFPGNPYPGRDPDELTPEEAEAGPIADSTCVAGVLDGIPATATRADVFARIQAEVLQNLTREGRLYSWPDGRDVPVNVVFFSLEPMSLPGGLAIANGKIPSGLFPPG